MSELPPRLTHVDERGQARMVDVSAKPVTVRSASARGRVLLGPAALAALRDGAVPKGDALAVARIAGLQVYLWTPRTIDCGVLLVPSLDVVKFDFDFDVNEEGILVLLSSDLVDRLLLDFSKSCTGEERMTVESQGINWMHVDY